MASPYETYRRTQAQTATKGELLLMIYDGAIRFACRAREAIEEQDVMTAHSSILRVEDIVRELSVTLDRDRSSDICDGLARLYDYMLNLLVQANVKKNVEPLDEVIDMLRDLRDTWRQAMRCAAGEHTEVSPGLSMAALNA